MNIIRSCRPLLWLKTLWVMLLASYLFFNKLPPIKEFLIGFVILGPLMWSGLYILNDLSDINVDKYHNEKRNRPIIAGKLSKKIALTVSVFMISISLVLASLINLFFFFAVLLTLINQLTYTLKPFRFKESANWDFISCGMLGQILRFLAGWFLFTTSFNIPILGLIFIAIASFFLMLFNDKFFEMENIGSLPYNLIYLTPIVLLIAPFYLKVIKNPNLYTNSYIRHVSYVLLIISLLVALPLL